MRLVLPLVLIPFAIGLLAFLFDNVDAHVTVRFWNREYADASLPLVVLLSVATGAGVACLIALVEGASIRLANHRLRRELRELERDVNRLRTQPRPGRGAEPDALTHDGTPGRAVSVGSAVPHTATAPVYGTNGDAVEGDPDEDVYSGGRAV